MKKWTDDTLTLTEQYISEHDPVKSPEEMFISFEEIVKVQKQFKRYYKREGKIDITMKKSKQNLARRKVFIKWYVAKHYKKNLEDCVKDLTVILFVSESTIYTALFNYR
tara:strand:+ start:5736 stop:6062 length:327 start_codon:yes stop_codon:yes gene_type:complete